MSIGTSGRIVIEVETNIKRELYSALSRDGMTLKEWFLRSAQQYLLMRGQIPLPLNIDQEKINELTNNDEKHSN